MRKKPVKKKRTYKTLRCYDLSEMQQFSLCDAMRQVIPQTSPFPTSGAPLLTLAQLSPRFRGWPPACRC